MAAAALVAKRLNWKIPLHHVRSSSNGVFEKLKKIIGIKGQDDMDSSNVMPEQVGEFLHSEVPRRMMEITSRTFGSNALEKWTDTPLPDFASKFKLLQECHKEFGNLPPNNKIEESKSVNDILDYYETLQRPGIIPEMWKLQNEELPKNLSFESHLPYKPAKKLKK